jgi:hypothetical protein
MAEESRESTTKISTGYQPRHLQLLIHARLKRFNVLVCHRRFGKTVLCINELVDQCLKNQKPNPRYAYFAPFYSQAKKVAWDYLKMYTRNIPGTTFNEQELRADLPGGRRIYIAGADNPDAHRGIYLDGCVLDEYAQMHPLVWSEVIRPALSDRQGFCIFIGTPKGRNNFYEIYEMAKQTEGWYTQVFKASETGLIEEAELEQIKKEIGEDAFNQEFECSFDAAVKGTYYGTQIADLEKRQRITAVPYDPSLGVITAWDLGIGDSTAIWFAQRLFREVRLIDYIELAGRSIPEIVKELRAKPYVYTTHLLPHDAAARELGTGKSRQEVLRNLGIVADVLPRLGVDDGIQAARNLLPLCWFDREQTHRGVECLREYRREWDDKAQVFRNKPLHNQWSHGADAFRMLAIGIDKERPLNQPERQDRAVMDYDEFAYGSQG